MENQILNLQRKKIALLKDILACCEKQLAKWEGEDIPKDSAKLISLALQQDIEDLKNIQSPRDLSLSGEIEKLARIMSQKQESMLDQEYSGKNILGFSLSKVSQTVKGKTRYYWLAHRCIDGKKEIIHIGKDPRKAEEKITKKIKK